MPTRSDSPTLKLVHEDARGEMWVVELPGDRELVLLHSKKGSLRGGHSHDVPEQVMVLTGEMVYHKQLTGGLKYRTTMRDGDCSYNGVGEVHMGEFTEDSWLIEWKICKDKHSWENHDDPDWRARVKASA